VNLHGRLHRYFIIRWGAVPLDDIDPTDPYQVFQWYLRDSTWPSYTTNLSGLHGIKDSWIDRLCEEGQAISRLPFWPCFAVCLRWYHVIEEEEAERAWAVASSGRRLAERKNDGPRRRAMVEVANRAYEDARLHRRERGYWERSALYTDGMERLGAMLNERETA
jgi:hypothetical protein